MRLKKYKSLYILLIGILSITASEAQSSLQSGMERIMNSRELTHSSISFSVLDMESGDLLASMRPNTSLTPASSIKVLTTLTAITVLGESYQFSTKVGYEGTLEADGTLQGDLMIYGCGDPTLGSGSFTGYPNFEQLLDQITKMVKDAGITCIDGDIIADESLFNSFPISPSWQWNDLGNYYASGAWGINVNENEYIIYFDKRGTVGRRPNIKSYYPTIPKLNLSNELAVDSAGTGDNAYIFGGPYNYTKRIVGTIPAGQGTFSIKGSIPDPPYFLAHHISKELEKSKIKTANYRAKFSRTKPNHDKVIIGEFKSPPLSDIVRKANFESNNLYCEALLKTLGLKVRKSASGQLGISAIRRFLKKLKVKSGGLNMEDGSGLSARSYVPSYLLADFLRAYANQYGVEAATKYLPKGGVSGTVRGMFKNTKAAGHIWAKSGSMIDVISYTGFVQAKSGKWRTFSIIINAYDVKNKTMRSKMEKMMKEIYFNS